METNSILFTLVRLIKPYKKFYTSMILAEKLSLSNNNINNPGPLLPSLLISTILNIENILNPIFKFTIKMTNPLV